MLNHNTLLANVLHIKSQKYLTLVAIISDYKRLRNAEFTRLIVDFRYKFRGKTIVYKVVVV